MVHIATYKAKVTFITPCLGSQSTRDVATQYIAKKHNFAIPEDEIESLPDALEQATTVFHRHYLSDGGEFEIGLFDYHVKGFLKAAGVVLNGQLKMPTGKPLRALRSKVSKLVFVSPRWIPLHLPDGGTIDIYERPLPAQTAFGQRMVLARSESIPENSWFECGISVYPGPITEEVLRNLFDYGYYQGLLQNRGSGFGRIIYEMTKEE